ncbi:nudC domain-containing protein 1 [Lucilia sericata]|uniref:nudC domain-containing protein 1 n=1 Tax=Lucilia sericata TaxID=13632 RepID=UPI0018A8507C|nr:nudC domain-containing protein 1 [Lucilia sericata]
MPKIVELRQDRSLIRSNFDGYKLSLDAVPLLRQELTSAPLKAEVNDDQYSLLHAELFSMQNLLTVDPWTRTHSYFINRQGEIVRCAYDENKGRPDQQQVVYRLFQDIYADGRKQKGDYNYSLRFLSEKFCLICDGVKTILLLETGDRLKGGEWKLVASARVEGEGLAPEEKNYLIYDARLDIIQEQKQISIILGHVQRVESLRPEEATSHFLYLHWSKWLLEDQLWKFQILDTLEGKGSVYYCAFEPRAESVVISSNHEFKWRSQNSQENGVDVPKEEQEKPQLHGEPVDDDANQVSGFSWTQTDEDIVIKFKVKEGKGKNDYNVKCELNKITVKCNDEVLLDQELLDKIDLDLTTWTIENNYLQITLIKQTSGLLWTSLLANSLGPKEDNDKNKENSLPMEQQPIANLEAPIEDCDFPMGSAEDEINISRFNLPTKTITHNIIMGSSPPLFATSLRPGFPLAIATRQDVDCCLWLQQYNPSKPDEWSVRHEGNLHAFGYVQASKQQNKFMDCSPDLGYAIIAESYRHVFLYKTKYDTASGLRNRNGPQVSIGKQHLITLEDAGEVLGLTTANSVATLLTEKCVLFLQMES